VPAASATSVRAETHQLRAERAHRFDEKSPAGLRHSAPESRREYIRRLVAAAPPVTAEQAAELRRLRDLADRAPGNNVPSKAA
jgi:hypothetical protein